LGERFEIANSNQKIYPCCSFAHGAIDAALMLVADRGIRPGDVRRIEIKVTSPSYSQACQPLDKKRRPPNPVFAQFSIPFFVAIAICKGAIDYDPVGEDTLKDPEILALSDKVVPENDPDLEDEYNRTGLLPVMVTIVTRAGRSFRQRVLFPKGHSRNPLSGKEVQRKFEHFAEKILSKDDVKDIIEMVSRLEEIDDVTGLCRKFARCKEPRTLTGLSDGDS
jgi:2-methylcitrate dehydratase PrpD